MPSSTLARCRVLIVAFVAIVVLLALAACSSDRQHLLVSTEVTSSAPPSTGAEPSDEEAVRSVVSRWYGVATTAIQTNSYDVVEVAVLVQSDVRTAFESTIEERIEAGTISRAPTPDPNAHEIIEVEVREEESMAEVSECVVDGFVRVEEATGEVLDDDVVTVRRRLTLERDEGKWRIAQIELVERWEGVRSCD